MSSGGAGGEIQLTDAMAELMKTQAFHAYDFEGERYDCGDKIGWLRANVRLGAQTSRPGTCGARGPGAPPALSAAPRR